MGFCWRAVADSARRLFSQLWEVEIIALGASESFNSHPLSYKLSKIWQYLTCDIYKISFIFNIYQRSFKYHSITSCKVGFCIFLPSCKKASHRLCRTLGSAATFTVSGQVSQWFCANSTTSNPTSQVWLSSLFSLSWSSFNQALSNQSQNIVQVWLVFAWKSSLHRAFTFLQVPWI